MNDYYQFEDLFKVKTYPAGEPHVTLFSGLSYENSIIEFLARDFNDLGILLTADRILKFNRIEANWFVPYFPFARHDRRIDHNDGMELDVALRMVENINVVALDPHSEVTSLLPHIPQREVVDYYEKRVLSPDMWIIPDVGASKKAHTWVDRDYRQCLKHRDMRTGQLSGFEVLGADLRGASCVIVDDICDGGGTFLGLADKLRDKGAGDLHLLVSHGLFTNGVSKLREKFDTITHVGRPFVNTQNIPYREIYSERKIV